MLDFNDFVICKYKSTGDFHEGLAVVSNQDGVHGYIDKTGKEVIRCQFESATDFSEGMAAIKVKGKWGYINTRGKRVIKPQFRRADAFSDGLAIAANMDYADVGYIDKTGNFVVEPHQWQNAEKYADGIGVLEKATGEKFFYKDGTFIPYNSQWIKPFSEGFSIIKISDNVWRIINTNFNSALTSNFKNFYSSNNGMFRIESFEGKIGYMNHDFHMQIPPVFDKGSDFSEDMAVIELAKGNIIGFIDKLGNMRAFLREKPFHDIGDFHCGRSRVYANGKFGFIDKEGNQVIPCQYDWTNSFSDGLAFVCGKGYSSYIDVEGKKVIELPILYCSKVQIGEETVVLKAESEEELRLLKEAKLKELRSQVVSTSGVTIDSEGASVQDDEKPHVMMPIDRQANG